MSSNSSRTPKLVIAGLAVTFLGAPISLMTNFVLGLHNPFPFVTLGFAGLSITMIGKLRYATTGKHKEALAKVSGSVKSTFGVLSTAIVLSAVYIILQIVDRGSSLDLLFYVNIALNSLGSFLVQLLVRLKRE